MLYIQRVSLPLKKRRDISLEGCDAHPVGPFRIFSKIRGDIRSSRLTTAQYQRHQRQNLPPVSLVLLIPMSKIPAANLPPVSTTPVANCHQYQRHRRQICHRHRWQTMLLISGCRYLKVNLKAKIYIYVNLLSKGVPTKL